MSATEEAERDRAVVAATAAVEANHHSTVYDELGSTIIEIASEIAAIVLLPGERSLLRHSLTDFANYPTYSAHHYVYLIDLIAVVALLDSATSC